MVLTGGLSGVQFGRRMSSAGWSKGVNKHNLASVVVGFQEGGVSVGTEWLP